MESGKLKTSGPRNWHVVWPPVIPRMVFAREVGRNGGVADQGAIRGQGRRGDLNVFDSSRRLGPEIASALVSHVGRPATVVVVRHSAVAESVSQLASPGPVWCGSLDSRPHVGLLCENIP